MTEQPKVTPPELAPVRALMERVRDGYERGDKGACDAEIRAYAATSSAAPIEPREPGALRDLLVDAIEQARKRHAGEEKPIATPWHAFNKQLRGGLWPGSHVLVAGTAAGKTTMALAMGLHAAKAGVPCLYVGLEIGALQVATRLLGEETWTDGQRGVAWSDLYVGEADPDAEHVQLAAERLSALPFFVERAPAHGWAPEALGDSLAWIRKRHEHGPLLVVLDFLQIVGNPPGEKQTDTRERIARTQYAVRDAAEARGAAVLVISSVARDKYGTVSGDVTTAGLLEDGGITRPEVLVGLGKESGEIEFAGDSLTVLVRPPKSPAAILATAKLRVGLARWCALAFNGYRFSDATDKQRAAAFGATRPENSSKPAKTNGAKGVYGDES